PFGAESDELINYELGLKGRWLNGRVAANLALYHIDWNDIQVQANRVSDQVQFATNIGGAYSRGVEFAFMAMPALGWTFMLNAAFNKARVDDLTPEESAISGAVKGARLAGPDFSGSMTVKYDFDWIRDSVGSASLAVVHVGSFPSSFPNIPWQHGVVNPPFDYTDSYTLVNGVLPADFEHYSYGVEVENMFDERSVTYVPSESCLAGPYGVLRSRSVVLRVGD